jgi:hypothetical protein
MGKFLTSGIFPRRVLENLNFNGLLLLPKRMFRECSRLDEKTISIVLEASGIMPAT